VPEPLAAEAIRLGAAKLPIRTRFIRRTQEVA
jgi:ribosomal protein L16/L10AE